MQNWDVWRISELVKTFFQMLYNDLGRYSDLHQMAWAPPELGLWNRKQYICQTQPLRANGFSFNKNIFDYKHLIEKFPGKYL